MCATPVTQPDPLPMFAAPGRPAYREDTQGWAQLPAHWLGVDVTGLAVGADDSVYLFTRGPRPVIHLSAEGALLGCFGEGVCVMPHGIHVAADGRVFLTDSNGHAVHVLSPAGEVLMTLGTPGTAAPFLSGLPFCRPTHTAPTPGGDILVADGYGNARVHRYAPDGRLLDSWGAGPGTGPGQFNVVHNIVCTPEGEVVIADRENHRLQVFDTEGRFLRQIGNLHRPCGLWLGADNLLYVSEFGPALPVNRRYPGLGACVSVLDLEGRLLHRIGTSTPEPVPGCFVAPHGVASDSRGTIYVGEVGRTMWAERFPDSTAPDGFVGLRRFVRA